MVVFAENRSFNNLFADFPGLAAPLSAGHPDDHLQRDRDGSVLPNLPAIWGGMVPDAQIVEHRPFQIREQDLPKLGNAPFALTTPDGDPLPQGVVKPQGDLNMHAGYSDVDAGDRHIAQIIDALQKGPQWSNMLVVITFDENGGWWDHVAPPKGDRWGPGTRIPAIIVSPFAKKGHVDHTLYDTGSIQRLINRRFGLEPLNGIAKRDAAMRAAGGIGPGDLTETLDLN